MFETRLKWVLRGFGLVLAVLIVRLIDLQVLRAGEFRKQAEDMLLDRPETLPFIRGRIFDRSGVELAGDRASWDVVVDYGIVAMEPNYLRSRAEQLRRREGTSVQEATERLHQHIGAMWRDLAAFEGVSPDALLAQAREICGRVEALRDAVAERRGFDAPVAEESQRHPILTGLDDQRQVAVRRVTERFPWVEVRDSSQRNYHPSPSLGHVLGRLAPVSPTRLRSDPEADDPLACYLTSELAGASGVEFTAERRLRGRRGFRRTSRVEGTVERIDATAGEDVQLTLRLDLQSALYAILERELPAAEGSVGGAVVVLDVRSREVLALVSYPGYDDNRFRDDYALLLTDSTRQPLRFRAVANAYAPGSIVKPLACAAGLGTGRIDLGTTFNCTGYLYPDTRSGPRCWQIHGTDERMSHGSVTVPDALANSCNIFLYKTGELVGDETLCNFFDMAGLGRASGMGLIEEVRGTNPTTAWLAARDEMPSEGRARNLAIGQGELTVTPVQAANLMAVYASGAFRPVTLVRGGPPTPEWTRLVGEEHWKAIRMGLFRVTNEVGAPAYPYAHFVRDGLALCGKTGSATARPWPISFTVPYLDHEARERSAVVPANTSRQAIEQFRAQSPGAELDEDRVTVNAWWPSPPSSDGPQPAHAWFVGYLQPVDPSGQPRLEREPRVAFSVLVEFGGSGGRSAGPIAVKVAQALLDLLGVGLDPDSPPGSVER